MVTRQVGRSNLQVTPLCLGGNVFGRNIDEETAFAVLDTYVELGGNFIDTADIYSTGASESVLGRWMKARGNRSQIILATKLGKSMGEGKIGLSRKYMVQAVEDSLTRLQTDYIDLYQSHDDDQNTPLEEAMSSFNDLVKQGKVRVVGASNYNAARLAEAQKVSEEHGYARYECLQPLYNLVERKEYEDGLEDFCRTNEVGVIPFFSLARGFLSGKYRPNQPLPDSIRAQGVQKSFMNEYGYSVLAAVDRVAEKHNATQTEVSLAWLILHPGITAPIASATSSAQVKELMKALELKLDAEDIALLDNAG
jgi:aryl-alcohol dehydrogenase-like predicted oxidoreductase